MTRKGTGGIVRTPELRTPTGGRVRGCGVVVVTLAMNRDQREAWRDHCKKAGIASYPVEFVTGADGSRAPTGWLIVGPLDSVRDVAIHHRYVRWWMFAHQWRPRNGVGKLAPKPREKGKDDMPGPGEYAEWMQTAYAEREAVARENEWADRRGANWVEANCPDLPDAAREIATAVAGDWFRVFASEPASLGDLIAWAEQS